MEKYKINSLPISERVEDLLSKMTIEEKAGQLIQFFARQCYVKNENGDIELRDQYRNNNYKKILAGDGIGLLYGALRADSVAEVEAENNITPQEGAKLLNIIQKYNIENTRLGIPLMFAEECTHGNMTFGSTVYPAQIGIGCSWNKELYAKMCKAIAEESRSKGVTITYSPVVDILRDIRWGRCEECYGEDVYYCSEMGVIAVENLQGESLANNDSIVAAVKHFIVHGTPESGINTSTARCGERELREVWLEPFHRTIKAGARSIITSYNEVDGVPNCCNKQLIKNVLKDEWGFDGFVFSDLGAVELISDFYGLAKDHEDSTFLSFDAGVDIDMLGECYSKYLPRLIEQGRITMEQINDSVRRILKVKFELGLFENPYVDENRAEKLARSEEYKKIAKQAALESCVLLKNDNKALPLLGEYKKIAVVGPNADNVYNQLGDYTAWQLRSEIITVLDGIKSNCNKDTQVLYSKGCDIRNPDLSGIEEAVNISKDADIVIAVVGGSSSRFATNACVDLKTGQARLLDARSSDMECGEGIDRCNLNLDGVQLELLKEIKKLNKKLIVVYINGRPISEPWINENADAILEAWYPGEQGGNAVAEILFGKYNPCGKLSVSVPKHVGQLPLYYCRKPCGARKQGYVEMDAEPMYEFGYGLSYTDFDYSNLKIDVNKDNEIPIVNVTLEVKNVGNVFGGEIVQLYLHDLIATVTRPAKELKGFEKVFLNPQEKKEIKFTLGFNELKVFGLDMKYSIEPGEFELFISKSVNNIQLKGRFSI